LEPERTALYYNWSGLAAGTIAQAQVKYIEIEDHSRSGSTTI